MFCLGVVHMEKEVQDRVQIEVGREEQGVRDTRKGTKRGTERELTINQPLIMDDHGYGVMRTNTILNQCGVIHIMKTCVMYRRKMTCEVYLCTETEVCFLHIQLIGTNV